MGSEQLNTAGARSRQTSVLGCKKLSPGPGLTAREVAAHQLARIHDATIRLVAEHGYKALKVREIVGLAEVSTRAFYEHFSSKTDCFLHTYRLINRRATRHIIAAQSGEPDWRERSRLVLEEFTRSLEREPDSARLVLIDAYVIGEEFSEETQRVERAFEGMLIESLARAPGGVMVPPLIVEGVVAGIVAVSRSRLLAGNVADLVRNNSKLVDWALCYPSPVLNDLAFLDEQTIWCHSTFKRRTQVSSGDRALILKSVVELALAIEYKDLTISRISSNAGVSRRKFHAYFDSVENCYLTALEQKAGEVMAEAASAQASANSKLGGTYRMIATLVERVAQDPFLAKVCLVDDFPRTRTGLRVRKSLIDATLDLCIDNIHAPHLANLTLEVTLSAAWLLFQRYVLSTKPSTNITASLAYLYLTPIFGPEAVVHAIRQEQIS